MLVLTRKAGEGFRIGGDIRVSVISLKGNSVRIGIEAEGRVPVHRDEVFLRIEDDNRRAAGLPSVSDTINAIVAPSR